MVGNMSPNKTKRGKGKCREDSPEPHSGPKKQKVSSDDEEERKAEDDRTEDISKASTSKLGTGGMRSPSFSSNKPAELFRKDLISAMKLADSEPLQTDDYLFIADPWRQEWEKGVQVPVNAVSIPKADIKEKVPKPKTGGDFKIFRKYLHGVQDETYRQGIHDLTGMHQLEEQVVRYDLDDLDVCWLQRLNEDREEMGLIAIHEWTMERIIEALEHQCHERCNYKKKTEEGMGIEYDEDVVCDVCRAPDSEENNEMVFCDGCDICVHQACYGIATIPEGSWLCRTCALGIKPPCILCPRIGGAMKSTRSGTKWSHVSCALWIPEVTFGCPERMEPITRISQIPASRWGLICCLCKERVGACIQCSVKSCKTALHVTCAFYHNMEMKTILTEDTKDHDDGVKLKAYCPRHSGKRDHAASDSESNSPRKSISSSPRKDLTDQEKARMRAEKLKRLEHEFYREVDIPELVETLQLDQDIIESVYNFWKLKRKTNFDRPLLMPKTEEADMLEKQQEDSLLARMKMFVHLRQDLERVRNLCYMVNRREKMKRQFYKSRESVFKAQVHVLTDDSLRLSNAEATKIAHMYNFRSIYDINCLEEMRAELTAQGSDSSGLSSPETRTDFYRRTAQARLSSQAGVSSKQSFPDTPSVSSVLEQEEDMSVVIDERKPKQKVYRKLKHKKHKYRHFKKRDSRNKREPVLTDGEETKEIEECVIPEQEIKTEGEVWKGKATQNSELDDGLDKSSDTKTDKRKQSLFSGAISKRELRELFPSVVPKRTVEPPAEAPSTPSKDTQSDHVEPAAEAPSVPSKHILRDRVEAAVEVSSVPSKHILRDRAEITAEAPSKVSRHILRDRDGKRAIVKEKDKHKSSTNSQLNKMSEKIRTELNGFFKSSQLVVDDRVKGKAQRKLLSSKSRFHNVVNGIHDKSQKKLESYFRNGSCTDIRNSSHVNKQESKQSSNGTALLNNISPGRENHWYGTHSSPRGSLSGYRIPKKSSSLPKQEQSPREEGLVNNGSLRSSIVRTISQPLLEDNRHSGEVQNVCRQIEPTFDSLDYGEGRTWSRSSRDASPDSLGSYRSATNIIPGIRPDSDRILTRSSSPASVTKSVDDQNEFIDVENLFDGETTPRRVTRSQLCDSVDENSRDSVHSPKNLLKSREVVSRVRNLLS